MRTKVRKRIEVALTVREFCRANPFSDPVHLALMLRFEEQLGWAENLVLEEERVGLDEAEATRSAALLASGWEVVNVGRADRDSPVSHGLSRGQLEDLASALTRFEAATERAASGRIDRASARARMAAVSTELGALIRLLDRVNRDRFRHDGELLTGWNKALMGPSPGGPVNRAA